MRFRQLLPLIGALFSLYIIWGSTYFVIRIGVESWPPLMMAGIRFLSAGILLLAFLMLRGHKLPPLRPMLNAALIGLLLLAVGNGFVTIAEHQNVPSGIAAVVVATVPLFTLCFSPSFRHPHPQAGMAGDWDWAGRHCSAQQRRQPERESVGRGDYPDRLDELGVGFRLRVTYRTADRHDGRCD